MASAYAPFFCAIFGLTVPPALASMISRRAVTPMRAALGKSLLHGLL
jgi:hypothetical protein